MKKIVIFGAGKMGAQAYEFYSRKYEVEYFIDNDYKKWNSLFCGIPVRNPNIINHDKNITIVVPNGKYKDEICTQLRQAGINEILLFEIIEKVYTPYLISEVNDEQKELIVGFKGGLGNQLFQYAFMRYMMLKGRNCSVDLSQYVYPHVRPFNLCDVFQKIKISSCNPYLREKYVSSNEFYYEEPDIKDSWVIPSENIINDMQYGYLTGYFQTSYYVNNIHNVLRNELKFSSSLDSGMEKYLELFEKRNTVAVHIRRGDYLSEDNEIIFGNICTKNYYIKAIDKIQNLMDNPIFIFFSNDIEWVRKIYPMNNAIYVKQSDFDTYEDWYDLYLMSKCKCNIIANSSFSWWGAWLNNYKKKIVIAPARWVNYDALTDICPNDWIRI